MDLVGGFGSILGISADGNTAVLGYSGVVWEYTRSNGIWSKSTTILDAWNTINSTGGISSMAISADGATIIAGEDGDGETGSASVFVQVDGSWIQQGPKLIGSGWVAPTKGSVAQGMAVAISADGNTAVIGGTGDGVAQMGAVWIFTRNNGVWTQEGDKLMGSWTYGYGAGQGEAVALSGDGNTAAFGGGSRGIWIFKRSNGVWQQDGPMLTGIDNAGPLNQGYSIAVSSDGQTVISGAGTTSDGAAFVFVRTTLGWAQQSELIGSDAVGPVLGLQGYYGVALSADGNTAFLGGNSDQNGVGALWLFSRRNGVWIQQGKKLLGSGAVNNGPLGMGALQGQFVALSADGNTAMEAGTLDNNPSGAVWTFIRPVVTVGLTGGPNPASYGSPVTLAATIAPAVVNVSTVLPAPGGSVQFFDGPAALGAAPLLGGAASLTVSTLGAGDHSISAVYSGDDTWFEAVSTPVLQTVGAEPTTTTITFVVDSQIAELKATIKPAPSFGPGASVQFVDQQTSSIVAGVLLSAGADSASLVLTPAIMTALAGHLIVAAFSGNAYFASSTSPPIVVPALINAVGRAATNAAPDELVSVFGVNLSDTTMAASSLPLPTTLGGVSITLIDSSGATYSAGIAYVSSTQVNFVIPSETVQGDALVVAAGTGGIVPVAIRIGNVAPGLFSAAGTGQGLAAAQILRVRPDGTQILEGVDTPIRIGSDTLYLILYGTGIRHRTGLASVVCQIAGQLLAPEYAGAQPDSPGLDQVNVLLPGNLAGAGTVNVSLTADGQTSNTVTLVFQ